MRLTQKFPFKIWAKLAFCIWYNDGLEFHFIGGSFACASFILFQEEHLMTLVLFFFLISTIMVEL